MRRLHRHAACARWPSLALLSAGAAPPARRGHGLPAVGGGPRRPPLHLLEPVSPAVAVLGDDDQRLELARVTLVDLGPTAPMWDELSRPAQRPDPRMAYPLANGHVLVSGGKDVPFVKEVDGAGNVVWEYRTAPTGCCASRSRPSRRPSAGGAASSSATASPAASSPSTGTTQADRLAVRHDRCARAPASNQLADPFCATQIPPTPGQTNGNVLIADSNDNHRVIEVRSDDYGAAAAGPRVHRREHRLAVRRDGPGRFGARLPESGALAAAPARRGHADHRRGRQADHRGAHARLRSAEA